MNRVVITGMGVIAANGHGLEAFRDALYLGKSRVRFSGELQKAHTSTKKM